MSECSYSLNKKGDETMYDTIVIGAGQAGLAIGYYLQKENQRFLLLEKGQEVGQSWKERYDSLVLFTPRMYNSLPELPLDGNEHEFPTRDEVVQYLKTYADTFHLPIQFNEDVQRVMKMGDVFRIQTNQQEYMAKNVVVATGPFQTPYIPSFSKKIGTEIHQLHSSQYKHPNQLKKGNVLVVGGGNSGAQIAVELSKDRETYLAVSAPLRYFPLSLYRKSIFWWFDKAGILKASRDSILGRLIRKKGDPIFGFELKQAVSEKKVIIKTRVMGAEDHQITFEDHTSLTVQTIIWATGFKSSFPWLHIEGILDANGQVLHQRGVTSVKGFYFIGLPWQHRRGSALLQGVGYDAAYLVKEIKNT